MRLREFKTIASKDSLELMRNPSSLLIGIIMPGFLLPFFMFSMLDFQIGVAEHIQNAREHRIGLDGDSEVIKRLFSDSKNTKVIVGSADHPLTPGKNCDVIIQSPPGFDEALKANQTAGKLKVKYDSLKETSMLTMPFAMNELSALKEVVISRRLKSIGIESQYDPPYQFIDLEHDFVKNEFERPEAASLVAMLIFSIYTASVSASAEIITAERERNTLEALLLTPTRRSTILRAKFFLIFLIACLSVVLTLLTHAAKYLTSNFHLGNHPSAATLAGMELMCVPMILTLTLTVVSCVTLLAAYSRSVQQSMGYSFYLGLLLVAAATPCFNPAISLASPAAFLPISGLAIAITDMLSARPNWIFVAVSTVVGLLYCVLLTLPATHLLQSDESLYNLQISPNERVKRGLWLRPLVFLFATVFLSMFYTGQMLLQWKAVIGVILTQVLAVLAPALAFLWAFKLPCKETLSLKRCQLRDIIGAVCLAPFTVAAAGWLFALQSNFLPAPESFFKTLNELIIPPNTPAWQVVCSVALTPAICEEILFRGVFQGLLSTRFKPRTYIPLIGVLFGAFHFSLFRFIPTGTLGMLLSVLVWRTGSIFPAMALHFSHNTIGALMGKQGELDINLPTGSLIFISLALGIWLLFSPRTPVQKST